MQSLHLLGALQAGQPLQALLASLGLPGALPGAVTANEVLGLGDVGGLGLVLGDAAFHSLGAQFGVAGVVAGEVLQPAEGEL